MLKEPFDKNNGEWDLYFSELGSVRIEEGHLLMEAKTSRGISRTIYKEFNTNDFILEATFTHVDKTQCNVRGLLYDFKDWDNYCYFTFKDRYFSIGVVKEGTHYKELDQFGSISIETEGTNDLKIAADASNLNFSINGNIVYRFKKYTVRYQNYGLVGGGEGMLKIDEITLKTGTGSVTGELSDEEVSGTGTGFLINSSGYVVTNHHVIEDATSIALQFTQGPLASVKQFPAEVVLKDKASDLALLKVSSETFDKVKSDVHDLVLSQEAMDVGTSVFVLGYPLVLSGMGKEVKFTDGKISSKTGYENDLSSYQTTVPIQPGNSGSPLFDQSGNLVGCVNAIYGSADNASYAIKAYFVANLINAGGGSIATEGNSISNLSLEEKIKILSQSVAIIKVKQ